MITFEKINAYTYEVYDEGRLLGELEPNGGSEFGFYPEPYIGWINGRAMREIASKLKELNLGV